jgi:hypothetical protein
MADIFNNLSHEPYKCTVKFMSEIKYLAKKCIYPTKKIDLSSRCTKKLKHVTSVSKFWGTLTNIYIQHYTEFKIRDSFKFVQH